jgi:hypothetical protein
MDTTRMDRLIRTLATTTMTRRRHALQGSAWLGTGVAGAILGTDRVEAKRKSKRKSKPLCRANGSGCKNKGPACRAGNCLDSPLTIEAQWTGPNALYATYVFVPKETRNAAPGPFISSTSNIACTPAATDCEDNVYPFACIDQADPGSGPAVTTIRKLLKGKYEYWIYVINNSPAGALTTTLRNAQNQVVRAWSSPVNPNGFYLSWHVFDLDGAEGSVKSVNTTNQNGMPGGAHFPNINVCPA